MSWKNVKEHYRIGHIVQIREGKMRIGSPYVSDLLSVSFDGVVEWGKLASDLAKLGGGGAERLGDDAPTQGRAGSATSRLDRDYPLDARRNGVIQGASCQKNSPHLMPSKASDKTSGISCDPQKITGKTLSGAVSWP